MVVQQGGGRNTFPKPGVDLPDITDASSLASLMKFYNLLAHGSMFEKEHSVFIVPENTWIFFITRASVPSDKRLPGLLGEVLNNFYFLKPGETPMQWHERIYNGMNDGSLFREILYKANSTKDFSIYEPGDLIQDLTLQFSNPGWPFMRLGVWECPIPRDVKEYLDSINNIVEVVKYDKEFNEILTQKLPDYAKEYPAYANGIQKIIAFITNFSSLSAESEKNFFEDQDVQNALANKIIKEMYDRFQRLIRIVTTSGALGGKEQMFYEFPNNLIKYSPSAFEYSGKSPVLMSSLYTLLNEKRFLYKANGKSKPGISSQPLLDTPKYRFIVVDACRSTVSFGNSEVFHAKRSALSRRLSVVARGEVCMTSLIQMTKNRFESLVAGKPLKPDSAIAKLLRGERISLLEFEHTLVTPEGSLRTVLDRPFSRGENVFAIQNGKQMVGKVQNVTVAEDGQLFYTIEVGSEIKTVPVSNVYKSKTNLLYAKLNEGLEAKAVENAKLMMQEEALAAFRQLAKKKYQSKILEEQKKQWEYAYYDILKKRFPNIKRYPKGSRVETRVNKPNVRKGSYVNINSIGVNASGNLGYYARWGANDKFYRLLNVNNADEISRYNSLLTKIPPENRFQKGSFVKITGMAEKGSFLNNKIGIVIDLLEAKPGEYYYKIQVFATKNASPPQLTVVKVKAERVSQPAAGEKTNIPAQAEITSKYTNFKLSPETIEKIKEEALLEAEAEMSKSKKEGGKRTRRHRKQKRHTRKRASKH